MMHTTTINEMQSMSSNSADFTSGIILISMDDVMNGSHERGRHDGERPLVGEAALGLERAGADQPFEEELSPLEMLLRGVLDDATIPLGTPPTSNPRYEGAADSPDYDNLLA